MSSFLRLKLNDEDIVCQVSNVAFKFRSPVFVLLVSYEEHLLPPKIGTVRGVISWLNAILFNAIYANSTEYQHIEITYSISAWLPGTALEPSLWREKSRIYNNQFSVIVVSKRKISHYTVTTVRHFSHVARGISEGSSGPFLQLTCSARGP